MKFMKKINQIPQYDLDLQQKKLILIIQLPTSLKLLNETYFIYFRI